MTTLGGTRFTHKPLQFVPYGGPPNRELSIKQKPLSGSDDARGNGEESAQAAHDVEAVDLTCSADTEAHDESSGFRVESESVFRDDSINEKEGVLMPASQGDTEDTTLPQPAPSKGSSEGIAGNINVKDKYFDSNSSSKFDGPCKEDAGLHTGDQLQISSASTPEDRNREVSDTIDATNSQMVGKAKTQASELPQCRLQPTPPSTPEDRNREVSDTIDVTNSQMVGKAKIQASELPQCRLQPTPPTSPSMTYIESSTEKPSHCIATEATTHQLLTEAGVQSEARNHTSESTSSDSSSESTSSDSSGESDADEDEDDDDDGDYNGDYNGTKIMSPTRKRKRSLPVHSALRKRQSQGPGTVFNASTTLTAYSTKRQKPSQPQKKVSFLLPDARTASRTQSSGLDTKMGCDEESAKSSEESYHRGRRFRKGSKAMGSNQSRVHSSATATPHTNQQARSSAKGVLPEEVQWHPSGFTFQSLSADVSLLTAIFRTSGVAGILTSSHAADLLKRAMCDFTKLDIVTIHPFTSDTCFLTSLVYLRTGDAGCWTGRPLPATSSLPRNRAYTASLREDGRAHDDVEEDRNDIREKPSSSRTRIPWSKIDDHRLRRFKKEGKSWDWIYTEFPERSPGAVQVRWYTKLQCIS